MAKVFPRGLAPENFRPPLNKGEAQVFDCLTSWGDDWTIYVQPSLGTSKPDFIALNDSIGVFVIEVKDWDPALYHRNTDQKDYKIEVYSNAKWQRTGHDPVGQISNYKRDVFNYFFASTESPNKDETYISAVLVMPQFDPREAKILVSLEKHDDKPSQTRSCKTFGKDYKEQLEKLKQAPRIPPPSVSMNRIRHHLLEPEFVSDQRKSLKLSGGAKNISDNPNNANRRRVRGCSGSGKSLGLAHRAARLALEGKSVLVLNFNLTLSHYLRDLTVRAKVSLDPSNQQPDAMRRVTFTHFFNFICNVVTCEWETDYEEDAWDLRVAQATTAYNNVNESGLMTTPTGTSLERYDAILIDEGQDFKQTWWDFLRDHVLVPGGEMLLVCDQAQDVYERSTWLDEMKGFGAWTELKESYRVPPDLLPFMRAMLSENNLGTQHLIPEVPVEKQLTLWPTTQLKWLNLKGATEIADSIKVEIEKMTGDDELAHTDITILCETHDLGREIFDSLNEIRRLTTTHIFVKNVNSPKQARKAAGVERQNRKKRFWGGAGGVKGCTVQSFKGWESKAIIYVSSGAFVASNAFIAISRVKGEFERPAVLTVINSCDEFAKYEKYFIQS